MSIEDSLDRLQETAIRSVERAFDKGCLLGFIAATLIWGAVYLIGTFAV